MGKDIHILLEIQKDNVWQPIDDILDKFNCRYYDFFNILESNFGGRGIPDELIGQKFKYHEEDGYWDFDFTADWLFGFSYVTLEELNHFYNGLNKVFVSQEFLDKFFELGGKLPDGMSLTNDSNKVYVEPLEEYEIDLRDFLKYGINEFKQIGKTYNVSNENIRMVFAFDW